MRREKKKIRLSFTGDVINQDILIGSHGDAEIKVNGTFELSGIIYNPKNSVTLMIKGDGRISFRGKCFRIIIKKMTGNCTLDLSEVTYKELHCELLQGKSIVIAGNTRAISPAILDDEAVLHVNSNHLLFNPITYGKSRIIKNGYCPCE
jgi:hypothetical protein